MTPVTVEVEIRTDTGTSSKAIGQQENYSDGSRYGRAAAFLCAGIVGGAIFIVVPILHLFTTWALPLTGLIACIHTLRTRGVLKNITGNCPACDSAISLEGGRAEFPIRDACPNCLRPLLICETSD